MAPMNILYLFCGCLIPVVFGLIVIISEFHKLWISWDGRYTGMSWFKIWRAERAAKRGDAKEYRRIMGWPDHDR